MAVTIYIKRGVAAGLPILGIGEPALTTDDKRVFIGVDSENLEILTKLSELDINKLTETNSRKFVTNTEKEAITNSTSRIEALEDIKRPKFYNSNGPIGTDLKVWVGKTTLKADGVWEVDYTNTGFTQILHIAVTPENPVTTAGSQPVGASIDTHSIATARGRVHKGTSAGLLAAMSSLWAEQGITVHVMVIGI